MDQVTRCIEYQVEVEVPSMISEWSETERLMFEGYRAKVARTPSCRRYIDFLPEDLNAVFNIERGILHQIQWLTIGIGSEGRLCDDDDATYGRR